MGRSYKVRRFCAKKKLLLGAGGGLRVRRQRELDSEGQPTPAPETLCGDALWRDFFAFHQQRLYQWDPRMQDAMPLRVHPLPSPPPLPVLGVRLQCGA